MNALCRAAVGSRCYARWTGWATKRLERLERDRRRTRAHLGHWMSVSLALGAEIA